MSIVTVKIDRKLFRKLKKKRVATIKQIPFSQLTGVSSFTTEDLIKEAEDYLNAYYGTNYKLY